MLDFSFQNSKKLSFFTKSPLSQNIKRACMLFSPIFIYQLEIWRHGTLGENKNLYLAIFRNFDFCLFFARVQKNPKFCCFCQKRKNGIVSRKKFRFGWNFERRCILGVLNSVQNLSSNKKVVPEIFIFLFFFSFTWPGPPGGWSISSKLKIFSEIFLLGPRTPN